MNYLKILLPGIFVWLCLSISFYISEQFPVLKNNFNIQAIIILIMIILYSSTGAYFYYKNGSKTNGLTLGIVMSLTALILDALITVPYVEIPNGRSYQSFFLSPFLWLLALVNVITVYSLWRIKVRAKK
jgi:hypothetical protein